MAHTEVGFQVIANFWRRSAPTAILIFRRNSSARHHVMVSPLPRNKRAKNPHQTEAGPATSSDNHQSARPPPRKSSARFEEPQSTGLNNPFANLEVK